MAKIKGILFDFDGTLVNTNEVIIASWQHTYRHYFGYEIEREKITEYFGEPLPLTIEREFPHADLDEACEIYRGYQREHAKEFVVAFPMIKELLKELKNRGYSLCIVTSRTNESTLDYLRLTGLNEYLENVVGWDDTDEHKPGAAPAVKGLEKLGIKGEEALMVGDGIFDLGTAKNAGVKSVLVGWRITKAKVLDGEEILPDYEISHPMELIQLLETM